MIRSVFNRRVLVAVIGFALVAWLIWWGWEYFGSAIDGFPADSVSARVVVIALIVGSWMVSLLVKRLRAARAGARLMSAVVRQETAKERPSAEALQLRERFEEAVARLQQKGRRHSLYDLPWYMIVGAPGSGKTTALVNSGLHFPVEQRSGRGAVRGVGGTRNCDWWFTDEAVFLDTAGRYTTQDSDAASDSAAWAEFLALLRKYRQRRPLNGVLVAISAQDLVMQAPGTREEHVNAIRRRLTELNDRLGIQLPVYLLVTKCDLVAGFTEYFDDLTHEGRAQVWGVTFPYERTRNSEAAAAFPAEFDALVERLNERVFGRVQDGSDPRRRARAFGFPQQMASLRAPLADLVTEVFGSTRFDKTVLLRGVYFTSGTQEGTPIDRLLGAIGRRFAVADEAIIGPSRGKAYFIERLLKEVVIPESGLAGVNRRFEMRKAAVELGAYAAMIAAAVLGVLALSVSYARNRAYIGDVQAAITKLQEAPAVPETASVELMLPRLNAVKDVFDAASAPRESGARWMMRWGLYQGNALSDDAREAYVQVLQGPLLTRVAERFRERFDDYASDPTILYEYLKGYLLLLYPREHEDREHLLWLAQQEWAQPSDSEAETGPQMLLHFEQLLAQAKELPAAPRNAEIESLIAKARSSVRRASIAQLAYLRLQRASREDVDSALRLDEAAGLRVDEVLRRKDGVSLSTPMISLYTKPGFELLAEPGASTKVLADLARENWVWGGENMPSPTTSALESDLFDIYEKDYIAQWDAVLKAIEVRPPATPDQAAATLAILSDDQSPWRNLLRAIDDNTFLVTPAEPKEESGDFLDGAMKKGARIVAPILGKPGARKSRADIARERITAHFEELHELVGGEGDAPIERVLEDFGQLQEKVKAVSPKVGNPSPLDVTTQAAISEATQNLRATAATLPEPVGAAVTEMTGRVESVVLRNVRGDLANLHAQQVAAECRDLVGGRYPLERNSPREATIADFGMVFGYGGVFDRFFTSTLEGLVDTSRRPWRWRPSIGDAPAGPAWMLAQFETARYIRDNFFRPGSQMLEVSFRATPVDLDPEVVRFVLRIDGQEIQYDHGPPQTVRIRWPGEVGEVVATFNDRSPVPPSITIGGNWTLFRLLDEGDLQTETEFRHVLTLRSNDYAARVRLEADSNRNPFFRRSLLQQFRCGS